MKAGGLMKDPFYAQIMHPAETPVHDRDERAAGLIFSNVCRKRIVVLTQQSARVSAKISIQELLNKLARPQPVNSRSAFLEKLRGFSADPGTEKPTRGASR